MSWYEGGHVSCEDDCCPDEGDYVQDQVCEMVVYKDSVRQVMCEKCIPNKKYIKGRCMICEGVIVDEAYGCGKGEESVTVSGVGLLCYRCSIGDHKLQKEHHQRDSVFVNEYVGEEASSIPDDDCSLTIDEENAVEESLNRNYARACYNLKRKREEVRSKRMRDIVEKHFPAFPKDVKEYMEHECKWQKIDDDSRDELLRKIFVPRVWGKGTLGR